MISRDDDPGGQVLGKHTFRYDLVPFAGETPVEKLFLYGQRLHSTVRQVSLAAPLYSSAPIVAARLPRSHSFAQVEGDGVVTSIRQKHGRRETRIFNPKEQATSVSLPGATGAVRLDGKPDERQQLTAEGMMIGPKRIATLVGDVETNHGSQQRLQ